MPGLQHVILGMSIPPAFKNKFKEDKLYSDWIPFFEPIILYFFMPMPEQKGFFIQ